MWGYVLICYLILPKKIVKTAFCCMGTDLVTNFIWSDKSFAPSGNLTQKGKFHTKCNSIIFYNVLWFLLKLLTDSHSVWKISLKQLLISKWPSEQNNQNT